MDTPAAKKRSAILDDAESAAVPLREFARSRDLNPNTLAWWKWKLKRSQARERSAFMPVVVASRPHLELRVGAATIPVHGDTDLALLSRVVQALA